MICFNFIRDVKIIYLYFLFLDLIRDLTVPTPNTKHLELHFQTSIYRNNLLKSKIILLHVEFQINSLLFI